MPVAAIAVGAATAIGGAIMGGQAAGKAASDQHDAATVALDFQQNARQQQMSYASQDFGQMAAVHQQLQSSASMLDNQIGTLKQQQDLFKQLGSQAQALLGGQSAASLSPVQHQIDQQRQQLQNRLRDQLGSGYAATSSGQEALARFSQQSEDAMNNAQQQAIGNYIGLGQQVNQGINSTYSTSSNIASQGINNILAIQQQKINAAGSQSVNYNPSISSAGYGAAGQGYAAGAMGQIGGALLGAGIGGFAKAPTGGGMPQTAGNLFSSAAPTYSGATPTWGGNVS